MKKLLFLFCLCTSWTFSQQYNLLPDSCFYVFVEQTDAFGENNYMTVKGINPHFDTIVNGNTYIKMINNEANEPYAVRQVNNKVYGLVKDSINELLLIDLDVPIGDTMYNLYAQGYYYHAYVYHMDSSWFNPDLHHKYFYLQAFKILVDNNWINFDWQSIYDEKYFSYNLFFFNIPKEYHGEYNIVALEVCSSDPLFVQNHNLGTCEMCAPKINYASLNEKKLSELKLYPNPSSDMLTIELLGNNLAKNIHVYDILGHELLTQVSFSEKTTLQVDEFRAGLYFVEVIIDGEKFRTSFVKE